MLINTKEKIKQKRRHLNKSEPWRHRLQDIRNRCNSPKNKRYKNYGERGIKCLLNLSDLKFMWFRDKAYNMNYPTVDREDNDGNYELSNCRFIERSLNSKKDKCRIVLQINKNGEIIKQWYNIFTVSKELKIKHQNIYNVVNGKTKTSGGFKWKYKEIK